MVDAGQFQREADAGQLGKRRGLPAVPVVPRVPMIDGGKRAESGQGGYRPDKRRGLPAAVPVSRPRVSAIANITGPLRGRARADVPRVPPRSPWCRRSTAGSVPSPGKAVINLATCRPWCRRSTPASSKGKLTAGNSARRSSTWQGPGPPRGRARGADDRRRATRQGGHRAARGADD